MGAAESWRGQHRSVRRLAARAGAHRSEAAVLRQRMRNRIARFGEPRLMAWAFVAGLVWASGRPRARPFADSRGILARLAGTALWALRFAHNVRAQGVALGLDRGSAMSPPAGGVPTRAAGTRG